MNKKIQLIWIVCAIVILLLPLNSFILWDLSNHLTFHALRIFTRWIPYFTIAFLILIASMALSKNLFVRGLLALIISCVHLINAAYLISVHIQETGFNAAFWSSLTLKMITHVGPTTILLSIIYLMLILCNIILCFIFPCYPNIIPSIFIRRTLVTSFIMIFIAGYCAASKPMRVLKHDILDNKQSIKQANIIWKNHPILKEHYDHQANPLPPHKKYNIIWVIVESYDRGFIDKGIAYNLKKLAQKSYFFQNIYQLPQLNNTAFGHFAYFCGIWIHSDPLLQHPPKNWIKHRCLPNILTANGYYTINLDGISKEYMNTNNRLVTVGFEENIGYKDIIKNKKYKKMPTNKNWGGLFDQDLYTVAWDKITSLKNKKPFFMTISTIDNHEPFTDLSPVCKKNLPPAYNLKQTIIKSGQCTDRTLGYFIKKIRKSSISKNTIIIISNDHLSPWKTAYIQALDIPEQKRKMMLIINYPDNRHKIIYSTGNHLDIGPTILEAVGFKNDTNLSLGWSLLSHTKGFLDTYLNNKEKKVILYATHMMLK